MKVVVEVTDLEKIVEQLKDGTELYHCQRDGVGQAVLVMETLADTANSVVYKVLLLNPRTKGSREFVVPELEPEPKALKVFRAKKGVLDADQLSEMKRGMHIADQSPQFLGFQQVGVIGVQEHRGAKSLRPMGCALMELAKSSLQSRLEVTPRGRLFVERLACGMGHTVAGLQCLQKMGVAHLDFKGLNLLCMKNGVVLLADFGTAQDMSEFINSLPQMRRAGERNGVLWCYGTRLFQCPQLGGFDEKKLRNTFMDRIVTSKLQFFKPKEAADTLLACDKWSLGMALAMLATPNYAFVEDAIKHRDGIIKFKGGPDYAKNLQTRFYEVVWEDECNGTPGACIRAGLASAGPALALLVEQVLLLLLRPYCYERATYEEVLSTPLLQLALPCLPEKGNPAQEQLKELLQRAANLPKSPADLERASAAAEAVRLLYVERSADDVRAGQPSPCAPGIMQKPFYQNLRLFTPWRKGTQGTEELQQHQARMQLAPAPSENSVAVHPPTETGAGSNPRHPQGCSSKASSSGGATATSTPDATLTSGAGAASAGGGAGARGVSNYGGGPSGSGGSGRCGSPINLVDPEPDTAAMFAGLKMVFPREGGAGSVDLTPADLARLDDERFLNDNLIDFYLKWVELTPAHSRFYFFNSFFYTKLSGLSSDGGSGCSNGVGSTGGSGGGSRSGSSSGSGSGNESGSAAAKKKMRKGACARRCAKTRDRVKEYTKGVDIFAKDFLLVPIFYKSHWSLAIVCHPGLFAQRMQQMAAQVEQHHEAAAAAAGGDGSAGAGAAAAAAAGGGSGVEAEPVIIHLDSLCGTADGHHTWIIVSDLRCWLKQEFLAQQQQPEQQMPTYPLGQLLPSCKVSVLPKQNNGCDCGLFTLAYVERFVHANPPALSKKAVLDDKVALSAVDPRLMRQDWFHPTVATCMRGHLRHMLLSMMLEQATDKTLPGVAAALADIEMYKQKQELLQEYVQHHQEVHPVCGYVAPAGKKRVRAAGAAAASAGLQPAPAEMMAGAADPGPDRTGQEDDAHCSSAAKRQRRTSRTNSGLAAAAAAGRRGQGTQVAGAASVSRSQARASARARQGGANGGRTAIAGAANSAGPAGAAAGAAHDRRACTSSAAQAAGAGAAGPSAGDAEAAEAEPAEDADAGLVQEVDNEAAAGTAGAGAEADITQELQNLGRVLWEAVNAQGRFTADQLHHIDVIMSNGRRCGANVKRDTHNNKPDIYVCLNTAGVAAAGVGKRSKDWGGGPGAAGVRKALAKLAARLRGLGMGKGSHRRRAAQRQQRMPWAAWASAAAAAGWCGRVAAAAGIEAMATDWALCCSHLMLQELQDKWRSERLGGGYAAAGGGPDVVDAGMGTDSAICSIVQQEVVDNADQASGTSGNGSPSGPAMGGGNCKVTLRSARSLWAFLSTSAAARPGVAAGGGARHRHQRGCGVGTGPGRSKVTALSDLVTRCGACLARACFQAGTAAATRQGYALRQRRVSLSHCCRRCPTPPLPAASSAGSASWDAQVSTSRDKCRWFLLGSRASTAGLQAHRAVTAGGCAAVDAGASQPDQQRTRGTPPGLAGSSCWEFWLSCNKDSGVEVSSGMHTLSPMFANSLICFQHVGMRSMLCVFLCTTGTACWTTGCWVAPACLLLQCLTTAALVCMWLLLNPPANKSKGWLVTLQVTSHGLRTDGKQHASSWAVTLSTLEARHLVVLSFTTTGQGRWQQHNLSQAAAAADATGGAGNKIRGSHTITTGSFHVGVSLVLWWEEGAPNVATQCSISPGGVREAHHDEDTGKVVVELVMCGLDGVRADDGEGSNVMGSGH
ncbi:hypothetical protein OEZ85_009161 [Tetradesmus obliquus]|uniref:Ubiquitin-like protease family profile domain-containing protein n=1 Tax=Tetradesmus obliquus TaxID=3088 RepID=A0ABY8TLB5_TETOB|nr:hypothetical protein OEZ85_009161 [Tetradesmus obliquus]